MRADYEVNLPRVQEALQNSGEARSGVRWGPDIEGLTGGDMEDIKANIKFEVLERSAWKRTAVVTDVDWCVAQWNSLAGSCLGS